MTESDPTNPVTPVNSEVNSAPTAPGVSEGPKRTDIEREMRSYQQWLVAMVAITIAAACLLVSAGHGAKLGTRPWSPNSGLRVIVELLNFNYAYPTPRGNDVKWFAQGLGAVAALVTAGVLWYVRTGRRKEESLFEAARGGGSAGGTKDSASRKPFLEQISLVGAAQIALVAFGAWAIYSYRWAHWPAAAMGEGVRNLIVIIWAVCLGRTMARWAALRAGVALSIVLMVTSVIGLWYHFERNPFLRLEYPIGNPIFFAACMLPALMLGVAGLSGAAEVLLGAKSQQASARRSSGSATRPVWVLGLSVVVLTVVGWAFVLTHSRGPQVALLAGLGTGVAAAVIRWVSPDKRRIVVLGLIAVVLAGAVLVGRPWLASQQSVTAGGRGASFRLRNYTWKYATDLFLSKPITGHGQASYLCLSQQMALTPRDEGGRSDAERDPTVFAAGLVGHAHNEWLEILAELGAVGFALMATALGLTFWAGWRAYLRSSDPSQRWFLLALMASLVAIIVEECADVALRMPVLPVIFYTIIGLLWACSSDPQRDFAESHAVSRPWLRPVGLVAAALGAVVIFGMVRRDWEGAVADGRVPELIEQQKWDVALAQAQKGSQNRLVIESLISAGLNGTEAAHGAARSQFEQFRAMLARQSGQANRARIRSIAEQDVAKFDGYARRCLELGGGINPEVQKGLWQFVPGIHSVASYMADVLLMKSELESLKQGLGMQPDEAAFLQNARQWLELDYLRDRFDTTAALRLLRLSGHMPMEYRVELLRIPLRQGPSPLGSAETIEAILRQILASEQQAFDGVMNVLQQKAQQASGVQDPDRWPDPYAPETFRLEAMAAKVAGRHEDAVGYSEKAAALCDSPKLLFYYPTALACALGDLARFQLLAEPDQPGKAVETCRRAIQAWPETERSDDLVQNLRRELSLYHLAAGNEAAAGEIIRDQVHAGAEERLRRTIGYGLVELCGMFVDRERSSRPRAFGEWMTRSLTLAPDYPKARWLAARVALEEGNTDQAIEHLKIMVPKLDDERQAAAFLQPLAEAYPESVQLLTFIESVLSAPENGDAKASASAPSDGPICTGIPETKPN